VGLLGPLIWKVKTHVEENRTRGNPRMFLSQDFPNEPAPANVRHI
jgi:hypothetical protein